MEGGAGEVRDVVVYDLSNGGGGKEEKRESDAGDPSVLVEFDGIDEEGKWRLQQVLELWSEWYGGRAETQGKSSQRFQGKLGYVEGGTFAARVDVPSKGTAPVFSIENSRAFNTEYEQQFQDVPRYDRAQNVLPTKERVHDAPPHFHTQARCFNCGSYSHNAKSCHRTPSLSTIAENLSKFEPIGMKRGGRGGRGGGRGGRDGRDPSRDPFDTRRKDSRGHRGMKRFFSDGNREDWEGSRGKRPRDEQHEAEFPRSMQSNGGETQLAKAASSNYERTIGDIISANTPAADKIVEEASPVVENECVESQVEEAPRAASKKEVEGKSQQGVDGVPSGGSEGATLEKDEEKNQNKKVEGNPVEDSEMAEEDELMYDSDSSDEVIIIRGVQATATTPLVTPNQAVSIGEDTKVEKEREVACAKTLPDGASNLNNGGAREAGSDGVGVSVIGEKAAPEPIVQKNIETPLIEIIPSAGAGVNNGISGVYQKEKRKEQAVSSVMRVRSGPRATAEKKDDKEEGELDIEEGEIVETSLGPKRVSEPGLFFPVATPGRSAEGRKSRRRRGFNGQQFYRSHSHDAPPQNHPPKAQSAILTKPKPLVREICGGNKPSSEMHASNVSVAHQRARQMQMRDIAKSEGSIGRVVGPIRGTPPPPPPVLQPPNQMMPGQHSNGANNMNHHNSVQPMHALHNNTSTGNGHAVIFGNTSHNCTPQNPRHLLPSQLAISGAQQMTQKVVMQSGLVGQQHQPVLARNPQIVVTPPAQHLHQMPPMMQPHQHPHHPMIPVHQFPANIEPLGQQQHEHYSHSPVPMGMGGPIGHVAGHQLSNHNQQPRFVTRPMHAPQQQYTPQQQVVQLGNSMVVINTNGQQVVVKPVAR